MRMIFPIKADSRLSRPCIMVVIIGIAFALPMPVAAKPQYRAAQADITELSIEQLLNVEVYSASKFVQKITEAPAAVSRKTLAGGNTTGYAVANLTLTSQKLAHGLGLSASIYNLFERRYADPGRPEHVQDVIQQDGRNLRLKLSKRC